MISAHFVRHFFAAENVDMQVWHTLHRVRPFIGDQTETSRESERVGDLPDLLENAPDKEDIFLTHFGHVRHYQKS